MSILLFAERIVSKAGFVEAKIIDINDDSGRIDTITFVCKKGVHAIRHTGRVAYEGDLAVGLEVEEFA